MSARAENVRTLVQLAGLTEQQADVALDARVLVTAADTPLCDLAADLLETVLGATLRVSRVHDPLRAPAAEVVVGPATARSNAETVYLSFSGTNIVVAPEQIDAKHTELPDIAALLGACYASAWAFRLAVPTASLPPASAVSVSLGELTAADRPLTQSVRFPLTFLAGAGAVGNGFALALSFLPVEGELVVADPDLVSSGNLNRQIIFDGDDVGTPKAGKLADWMRSRLPNVTVRGHESRLQDLPEKSDDGWLENLVVAVDSRRARRQLQSELPLHVFDASTTDFREVVLHFATSTADQPCLRCTYPADDGELAHERHVAEILGVDLSDVQQQHITEEAANKIAARYPNHDASDLEGLAFDSVFKELCGSGELRVAESRVVVAPLAFVSILAGTLLALEFFRRVGRRDVGRPFDHWRVSPWSSPVYELRASRQPTPGCMCRSDSERQVVAELWG